MARGILSRWSFTVLLLAGVSLYFWGWKLLRALFVPLFLLALAIPVPSIVFDSSAERR